MESFSEAHELDPEHWVELHGDALFSYAMVRVNDRPTAEDLVQDTLLSAVRGRQTFRGASSVRTWLVRILRHKIIDYFRSANAKQVTQPLHQDVETVAEFSAHGHWLEILGKWPTDPAETLLRQEFWQVFDECRAKLPPILAAAFTLREVDGQATEQVCEQLGVTAANLAVRVYRARLLLRRCLDQSWFQSRK